jgi:hypothetical protein
MPTKVITFRPFISDDLGERLHGFHLRQNSASIEALAFDAEGNHLNINDFHNALLSILLWK